MNKERYCLVTFESNNHALRGEQILKENGCWFKTIPTPREVSTSCGLSLLFQIDDLDKVKGIIHQGDIKIDEVYKYTKSLEGIKAEKIL